jgi:hypothetical protein
MTANNKILKYRRTLVSLRAPSMSCKNPNSEIYAEISETLGTKFQNVWNFTLRVFGGALEEAILSYAQISPNVQVLMVETPQKGGSYRFF